MVFHGRLVLILKIMRKEMDVDISFSFLMHSTLIEAILLSQVWVEFVQTYLSQLVTCIITLFCNIPKFLHVINAALNLGEKKKAILLH